MKYDEPEEGEWINPQKRGYKIACCDCGLVHKVNFKHVKWGRGRKIMIQVFRDNRATGQMRRKK